MLNSLPDSPKNYKLKKKIEAAYRTLKRAIQRHEDLITDSVPAIKSKKEAYPKEFIEIWNVYKDFMIEQLGIRMGSRMQKFRLELLFDLTDNDFLKAAKWLKYYMASGSQNIYPVKDFVIEQTEEKNDGKKAGFVLPGQKK